MPENFKKYDSYNDFSDRNVRISIINDIKDMVNEIKNLKDKIEELTSSLNLKEKIEEIKINQQNFIDQLVNQNKEIISKVDNSHKEIEKLKNETQNLNNFIKDNITIISTNISTIYNPDQLLVTGINNNTNNYNNINKNCNEKNLNPKMRKKLDQTNKKNHMNNIIPLINNKNKGQKKMLIRKNGNIKSKKKNNYASADRIFNTGNEVNFLVTNWKNHSKIKKEEK